MMGKLRVLALAVAALGMFGVVNASGARAANEFHCSVEPCTYTLRQDGTAGTKTAHQVIEVTDGTNTVSFTCSQLKGHITTLTKTVTTITLTDIIYSECSVSGSSAVAIRMNGCHYHFIIISGIAVPKIQCVSPKKMEIEIPETKCIYTINSTEALSGAKLHNIGEAAKTTTEITMELNIEKIPVTADGTKAQCGVDPTKTLTGHYSTGNVVLTGETDPGGVMANVWYE